MKELNEILLSKLLRNDSSAALLDFSSLDIGSILFRINIPSAITNTYIVNAAHNKIQCLNIIFHIETAWWIDISNNQISDINYDLLPYALGLLNLSSNRINYDKLHVLNAIHLLRLTLMGKLERDKLFTQTNISYHQYRNSTINLLPNIWVLDDDFISHSERHNSIGSGSQHVSTPLHTNQHWGTRVANSKESTLLRLLQNVPIEGCTSDCWRLDVLLEDHLEEMKITYIYNRNLSNNTSNINILQLLSIPHATLLDLSVLLTAMIYFPLPKRLLKSALIILLSPYLPLNDILGYYTLPLFVNTAIVSIIRRICRRDVADLTSTNALSPRPNKKDFPRHTQEYLKSCTTYNAEDSPPVTYMKR